MASSHLKRIVAPKTWPIVRKTTAFITRPTPKGARLELTMPIVVIMRDMLKLVDNRAQARTVLRTQEVTVCGKRVYDSDAAVGFMDIFAIGGKTYRMSLNTNNQLTFLPVKSGEEFTLERITGKTNVAGGKVQLNCQSGRNLLLAKDAHKVGDTIAVREGKIVADYPLKEGASVLITGGTHIGTVGTVTAISGNTVTIEEDGKTFTTAKRNAYVVGAGKPAITLN